MKFTVAIYFCRNLGCVFVAAAEKKSCIQSCECFILLHYECLHIVRIVWFATIFPFFTIFSPQYFPCLQHKFSTVGDPYMWSQHPGILSPQLRGPPKCNRKPLPVVSKKCSEAGEPPWSGQRPSPASEGLLHMTIRHLHFMSKASGHIQEVFWGWEGLLSFPQAFLGLRIPPRCGLKCKMDVASCHISWRDQKASTTSRGPRMPPW